MDNLSELFDYIVEQEQIKIAIREDESEYIVINSMKSNLEHFKDGYKFARSGVSKIYDHHLIRREAELDPEYQEYQRLKKKFNDIGVI